MKRGLAIALGIGACAVSAPVYAANPALDEAKKLTAKASIEYDVGHFDQALELYTKAYERYPKPALLFDIGQCHRQLGHHERAVFFFQGYLRGQPEAANREMVEKFIAESQQKLDAQRAAASSAAAPAPASGAAPAPGTAGPAAEDGSGAPASTAGATPDASGPQTPRRASPALRIAGLATGGVGVVLLGIGIAEGLHAQAMASNVSQVSSSHGAWTPQAQSDYDSGKSAAVVANVLFVTGAVALAAGAAMTWYFWPRGSTTTAAVAPLPGGAAASLVSSF